MLWPATRTVVAAEEDTVAVGAHRLRRGLRTQQRGERFLSLLLCPASRMGLSSVSLGPRWPHKPRPVGPESTGLNLTMPGGTCGHMVSLSALPMWPGPRQAVQACGPQGGRAYLCARRAAALCSGVVPSPGGTGTPPCGCTPGGEWGSGPGLRPRRGSAAAPTDGGQAELTHKLPPPRPREHADNRGGPCFPAPHALEAQAGQLLVGRSRGPPPGLPETGAPKGGAPAPCFKLWVPASPHRLLRTDHSSHISQRVISTTSSPQLPQHDCSGPQCSRGTPRSPPAQSLSCGNHHPGAGPVPLFTWAHLEHRLPVSFSPKRQVAGCPVDSRTPWLLHWAEQFLDL